MPKTKPKAPPRDPKQALERTSFQTSAPWDPGLQLGSDVAMCYPGGGFRFPRAGLDSTEALVLLRLAAPPNSVTLNNN